jgi:hypothetical protein
MTSIERPSRFDRVLPLSGAAFSVLMVAGAAAFPMPPGGDVSPASSPLWLAAHADAIIGQSYVRTLAALAFLGLAAAIAAAIRQRTAAGSPLPGSALVGGALTGTMLLLAQAVGLAAALFSRNGGSADAVRALGGLQDTLLNLSSVPAVLMFAALGISARQTGLLPRWLTVVTLLGVPFAAVDAGSYEGGPLEPVGLLGLVFFLAWALLVGVRLTVQTPARSSAASLAAASAST